MHVLPRKTHLCLLPGAWLLERMCISTETPRGGLFPAAVRATLSLPLPLAQVGLAPHPHLVKRSQRLGPGPSSGAGQWQSILRMLLLRQVTVPAPSPGSSDHWEPTEAPAGRKEGRGGSGS